MTPSPEIKFALALTGLLLVPFAAAEHPYFAQIPDCSVDCPPGSRLAQFEVSTTNESLQAGWFVYTEGTCESICAPIEECFPPNVPVITADTFECRGLPGLSDVPADVDVDPSFGLLWDPSVAAVDP